MSLRSLSALVLLPSLFACGDTPALCDNQACTAPDGGGDSTLDGSKDAPGVDAPLGCNLTKDPKDSAACIDDTVGIFVDAKASDTNPGTKAKPVATVNHALDLAAKQSLPRVYVCEGTYPAVSVDGTRDGKSAYGAFDCATWQVASKTVTVQSPDNKPALTMSAAGTFVDIAFVSKDAVTPSDSSIAVLANGATLTLRRAKVTAGVGASGMKPTDIADFGARAPDGDPGKINNGGSKVDNVCGNGTGTSSGAGGGGPNNSGTDGSDGNPNNYPVNPLNATGLGGKKSFADCSGGSTGRNGSYGPGGTSGAGATLPGILSASGWTPAKGGDAAAGKVGQGGGGGASLDNTGGGGGGGTGGCGGVAGAGGTGGGASLAIVSFNSTVTLESTTLVTSKAGNGGQGGTGQKAQQGGNVGSFFIASCNGGSGGHGGSGGGGGGGAGGLSVGIAYSGTAPKIDGASVSDAPTLPSATLGMPGAAGAAGAGGPAFKTANPASNPGADGTPGVAGIAAAVKAI